MRPIRRELPRELSARYQEDLIRKIELVLRSARFPLFALAGRSATGRELVLQQLDTVSKYLVDLQCGTRLKRELIRGIETIKAGVTTLDFSTEGERKELYRAYQRTLIALGMVKWERKGHVFTEDEFRHLFPEEEEERRGGGGGGGGGSRRGGRGEVIVDIPPEVFREVNSHGRVRGLY
jgi:hypothetical protein